MVNKNQNSFFFLYIYFIYLFIFIFIFGCVGSSPLWGLSPVAASGNHSSSRCTGLSLSRPLLLQSTGSRRVGSVIVAHGPSCSVACGILPDQGSNPCPLHWQADSQPLRHQGSPEFLFYKYCSSVRLSPSSYITKLFKPKCRNFNLSYVSECLCLIYNLLAFSCVN